MTSVMDPTIEVFDVSQYAGRARYAAHSREMVRLCRVDGPSHLADMHEEAADLYDRADQIAVEVEVAIAEEST